VLKKDGGRRRNSLDCKSPWKAPKGNEECVVPGSRELLRVRIQEGGEEERVLVWSGPREEVLEEGAYLALSFLLVELKLTRVR
jgi:hypothetical protein